MRYEHSKEMIKNIAGAYDKSRYKETERLLSSSAFSNISIRLFCKNNHFKMFDKLDYYGKIKVLKFIFNISRDFNPSEVSVFVKFWGVTPDFPKFTEKDKIEIQELTDFIGKNVSEIIK